MHPFPTLSRASIAKAFLVIALSGCSSSTPQSAAVPEAPLIPAAELPPDQAPVTNKQQEANKPMSSEVKTTGGAAQKDLPDDYALTQRDCADLGKRYGAVQRSDQLVVLNPKLTAAQRMQVESNIDKVVSKLEAQWTETCLKQLVGGVIDRKALTCALDAKTVKTFDVCLNGEGRAPDAKGPDAPKK